MRNTILAGVAAAAIAAAATFYITTNQQDTGVDFAALSADDKAALHDEIRAYLLENPSVIFEAVEVAENRNAEAQLRQDETMVEVNAKDIFEDGYSWIGGNPDGDITLVEFVDYRCGYCRRAHDDVAKLVSNDGNIRLIMKEFPILGEDSMRSSQFAIAVKQLAGDDAYKAAHDALITMRSGVNEVSLTRLATTLGLDAEKIMAHMENEAVLAEIQSTRALAQRLKITGTPTFVMHDELLRGYLPQAAMAQLVSQKRG